MASPPPTRFAWRTLFARSRSAVFVVGGDRRLRFANPAWERLTAAAFAPLRGLRISLRKSATDLGNVLCPPPEVWAGELARVRRAPPGTADGPPWWDVTFLPLLGDGERRVLAVVGVVSLAGEAVAAAARVPVPEAVAAARAAHAAFYTLDRLAGPSDASERLLSQVRAAAVGEMPVWVVGERGTGKETAARVIHHTGPRRERAFVGLNCGGLQPYLIDGLLFGKGGASGGRAVGTLYLKHPHELTAGTQARVLNWCESAAGPRLICGSSTPPAELAKAGTLDRRFLTRYAAFEIALPPLRARPEDLPRLIDRLGGGVPSAEVLAMLRAYPWPGNLPELAAVVAGGLTKERLPRAVRERHLAVSLPAKLPPPPPLDDLLAATERRLIQNALAEANGDRVKAAERLGVPRGRLWRRMAALGLAEGEV